MIDKIQDVTSFLPPEEQKESEVVLRQDEESRQSSTVPLSQDAEPVKESSTEVQAGEVEPHSWQAEAGRKGARRVHQLIQRGRLYEKEHGLKKGRQRLRQLIELGKLYEQEHGLRPAPRKKRLSRLDREELLATFLECLLRMAKPSFRDVLKQMAESLRIEEQGQAA